jgi:capsular exopolysaccharide synthesis family protein
MVEGRPVSGTRRLQGGYPGPQADGGTSLTPKEVMGILRRHVLLIIFVTMLGFCLGGGTWYGLRRFLPSYSAEALIEVLPPIEDDPTQISQTQTNKDNLYNHRVTMANLIKQQKTYQDLLQLDTIRKTAWFQQFDNEPDAIKYLMKYLTAYPHRDADFVSVSMNCGNAKEAADIANTMSELFVSSQRNQKQGEIDDKLAEYARQQETIQMEIDGYNKAIQDVRDRWGVTFILGEGSQIINDPTLVKLNSIQQDESKLLMSISQLGATIQNLERLASTQINDAQIQNAIQAHPMIQRLEEQISMQKATLEGKSQRFGPNHRVIRQAQILLEDLETQLAEQKRKVAEQTSQANLKNARDTLVTLQANLETLQKQREEAEKNKEDADRARVEFERLDVKLKERQTALAAINAQIDTWRIKRNTPGSAKVLLKAAALPPLKMTATRHPLLWFPLGLVLGLVCGVGLAFLIELMNDLVRTARDVSRYLQVPLLGIIPDDDEDDDLPRETDLYQVVRHMPYSQLSEAYRRFRTNLELSKPKTMLIASGEPEDGKTTCAANLALSLVAKGKKVVLIDGNFRQPMLQKVFPRLATDAKGGQYGLSNLLMGQCTIRQGIRPAGVEGLDVIDTGLLPPNPMELLSSPRMDTLIQELRKVYDHIILDSAPVLLVSDAKVLARLADATVLVLNADATRRGAALRVLHEMRSVNTRVVGVVLFGARSLSGGYFREQQRSYQDYMQTA